MDRELTKMITVVFFLLMTIAALSGCSLILESKCYLQGQAIQLANKTIVENLQCTNLDAVDKDVTKLIGGIGLCKKLPESGTTASFGLWKQARGSLCPIVSDTVAKALTDKAIPAEWGCSAQGAKDRISQLLTDACNKIPLGGQ